MNSWTFFAYLFQHFDATFQVGVQTLLQRVLGPAPQIVGTLLPVYIASTAAMDLYNSNISLAVLWRRLLRCAVVLGALGAATYNEFFATFLLTDLPNGLTAMVTGAVGTGPMAPEAFDTMFGQGWSAGLEIWKKTSVWSADGFGVMVIIVVFWVVCLGATVVAFLVFILSHILLGMVIAIGPLCVICFLSPRTESIFNNFVGVILSLIMTQVLVVGLLSMIMTTVGQMLHQIDALDKTINLSAQASQLHYLLEGGALLFAMGYLTKKMPEVAQAIFRGISLHLAPLTSGASAVLAGGTRMAGQAINPAATGSINTGAAGLRSITPTPMRPTP